jgi:beta-lactamase class C
MAYCIIKDNKILSLQGIGVRDVRSKLKVDSHTKFRIGSLSKSVTATLIANLVEKGELSWNTKVTEILPEFQLSEKFQTNNITIAHLLSHSTGLPYHAYTNLIEAGLEMEEILPYFKKVKLIGKEGELCAYQNAAFSVIEPILEKLLGTSIDTIYQDFLFNPAGMCDASVNRESILNNNHATPHRVSGNKKASPRNINSKYYNAIPCGGINASISDMARLLQLAMGNFTEIVSDSTLSFMTSPFVPTPGTRYFDKWSKEDSYYGMGWRILQYNGHKLAYHGGYVNNYRSEMAIDLENNLAICLLFNANSNYAKNAIPTFLNIWDTYDQSNLKGEVIPQSI